MWTHRLLYLLVLILTGVLYVAYGEWMGWLVLIFVLGLPLVSLIMSLPALITTRIAPNLPEMVEMGEPCPLQFRRSCKLPVPQVKMDIWAEKPLTGEKFRLKEGQLLPTEHCGKLVITLKKGKIYDYLCLFCRRLPPLQAQVLVLPRPQALSPLTEPECLPTLRWTPKPGGGFSENHEIRLYRPGDNLNLIHWKLSAKAKKTMIREPISPADRGLRVALSLAGTPEVLDRKLGRLRWLSLHLLERGWEHRIFAATGTGIREETVSGEDSARRALLTLLGEPPAPGEELNLRADYRIGGEPQ